MSVRNLLAGNASLAAVNDDVHGLKMGKYVTSEKKKKKQKYNVCSVSLAVYDAVGVPSVEETVTSFSLSHSYSYQS